MIEEEALSGDVGLRQDSLLNGSVLEKMLVRKPPDLTDLMKARNVGLSLPSGICPSMQCQGGRTRLAPGGS